MKSYDIYHISSSSSDDEVTKSTKGLSGVNDSDSSSDDGVLQLPVRYLTSSTKTTAMDAYSSKPQPNYSALKKKTISDNQHTVTVKHKRGPVFYQSHTNSSPSSSTNESKKTKVLPSPVFYQDTGAKSEDTSSTTSSSSETSSEDENMDKLKKETSQKPPSVDKSLLDSFLGISLSSPMNNLFMKNVDSKLNYNEHILFKAAESGNAFDEKTLLTKNDNKKLGQKNDTYSIYLNKSNKTNKELLENLTLPYHCHIMGMCKGSDENKRVHQLEKMDDNMLIMNINSDIDLNGIEPDLGTDELSLVLFHRKFADMEEQKFVMVDKEIFNQKVLTKDYNVYSDYGDHVIMMELKMKPLFNEFFKDQGLSKIIKLNFSIPGKTEKCGYLFYINDKDVYADEDTKIFIHQSSLKEDNAPPLIMVFKSFDDGLRLDTIWVFYGKRQEEILSSSNNIYEDIQKYVNSKMNNKTK